MKIKCDVCGKVFYPGETDGIPNGVGYVLEDGTVYNVCSECLMKVGEQAEGGKNDTRME